MKTKAFLTISIIFIIALSGCSAQQGYASAQAWQRSQCLQRSDSQERSRCLKEADQSYDSYRQQAEGAKAGR